MNHYAEFDALIALGRETVGFVLDHAPELTARPAASVGYSTPSLMLGLHTPSLLLGIGYSSAFRKGRKLRSPGDRTDYISYEYDDAGRLLRIIHHDDSLHYRKCFLARGGWEWSVPIFHSGGAWHEYGYYCTCTRRDERGRVLEFGQLRGDYQLILERYRYAPDGRSAVCEFWWYTPKLKGSDRSVPVTDTGSPADLHIFELDLTDPKKVRGREIESWTHDQAAFRQDLSLTIAPQVHHCTQGGISHDDL